MDNASPLLALALAVVLVLLVLRAVPAANARPSWGWGVAFLATLVLFLGLATLPGLLPGDRLIGERWNWSGPLLGLAGALWIASMLVRRVGASWREMGFTWFQRPGSIGPALWVSAVALSLNALAMGHSAFRLPAVPLETWLYQATVPGLVEEPVFRGVLLALLDRAFASRRNGGRASFDLLGASIGWGGVVVTLVFVALHGVNAGTLTGVLPAAVLYLWLRVRTGSLVVPIVVHNLWNLLVHAAHL